MKDEEPARADIVRRMSKINTDYTWRERAQDKFVEGMFRFMRVIADFIRYLGRKPGGKVRW